MAVVKTYLGAVKPIGEKILLQYTATSNVSSNTPTAEYDFLLSADYYITALSITKVRAALPAPALGGGDTGVALAATVSSVNEAGTATTISQAGFKSNSVDPDGVVGKKSVAGLPSFATSGASAVAVGAIVSPLTYASITSFNGIGPIEGVINAPTGTNNAQQKLRLTISWDVGSVGGVATALNPSCFVEIRVAKYAAGITQGVVGATSAGIQSQEVLIPPTA